MPMTVVPGRFTPAILSIGYRLPSFKYAARRVAVFVPRSAASISVETNSSVRFRSTFDEGIGIRICLMMRFDLVC